MSEIKQKMFTRLKPNHDLVNRLLQEDWWRNLVRLSHVDPDINIQLRSESINVYSKMGNFLRISLINKKINCEIHYKYLISALKSPYVKITPEGGNLIVSNNACPNVNQILNKDSIKVIKQNIATYAGEEKSIQSRLVEKNKETIVDVEVAFTGDNQLSAEREDARIDLVNYDKNLQKLVFVELKQIFDKRLYTDEINKQIEKYYKFANTNRASIVSAYREAIKTKKLLGIIVDTDFLASADILDLEPKPILAIAGYNQDVIDGLKVRINKLKNDHLAGLYFFGVSTDLNLRNSKNKTTYI